MEFHKFFKLKSMLQFIVVVLCVFSAVFADLIPNYSDSAKKVVYFDERDAIPLFLTCLKTPAERTVTLKWEKDGKDVSKVPSLENRFNLTVNGFVIHKPNVDDAGKYKCSTSETPAESATIDVIANVYVEKMPEKTAAVRTTRLEVHCKAHGTAPKIEWSMNGKEIANNNNTRIKFTKDSNNIERAILVIESVERNDQNTYNCTATNHATDFEVDGQRKYQPAKSGTFVKVRGTVWGRVMSVCPFRWFS